MIRYTLLLFVLLFSCCPDDGKDSKTYEPEIISQSYFSEDNSFANDALLLNTGELGILGINSTKQSIEFIKINPETLEKTSQSSFLLGENASAVQLSLDYGNQFILLDKPEAGGIRNVYLYKYDLQNTVTLLTKIPSDHNEIAVRLIALSSNELIVLARRKDNLTNKWGFVLYKIIDDIVVSSEVYPHSILLSASDIVMNKAKDGFYVFGHIVDDIMFPTDFVIYEFDLELTEVRKKIIGGAEYQEARKLRLDAFGNIYLFGHSADKDILHDMILIKLDKQFNLIYEKYFGSSYHDGGQTFQVLNDQSISIIGRTNAPKNTNESIYFMKLNSDGGKEFEIVLGDEQDNRADIIVYDGKNEFIIGSKSEGSVKNIELFKVINP